MSSRNYYLSSVDYAAAGAASGVFTRFTCHPLDVIKIRFQIQIAPTSQPTVKLKYNSILQTFLRIQREEGIFSLWKGHIPAQWLSIVFGAAQFASYETLTNPWRQHSIAHFAGGAISGIVAVVVSFPFDTVRTRLVAQYEPKIYKGMIDAGRSIIVVDGWRGLFKGLTPACLQTAPFSALIFGFNNFLTRTLKVLSGNKKDLSTLESLGCGSLSGVCGKTVVYPLDLIKKRLQVQGMPDGSSASGPIMKTSGLLHCLKTTLKSEGVRGLYKGFAPSVLKAAISSAVYFTVYDRTCLYFSYLRTA